MSALTIAQRLRTARAEAGLSQKELAALSGVAQPNISRYEKGSAAPTTETVDKLFAAIVEYGGASVTLAAVDGTMGVFGRTEGKLQLVDLTEDPEPIDWIAGRMLARGYTTLLAGEGGAGKTMLCNTIAVALANGEHHAAGMALPGRKMRVLTVDAENGKNLVLQRAKENLGLTEDAYGRYHVAVTKGFDLKYDFEAFRQIVDDAASTGEGYDVIVLDSMTTVWSGSEQSVNDVREFLGRLSEVAAKYGCAILLIHHTGKDGEYRGSSAIQANITCGLFEFVKVGGDGSPERRLSCAKMRIAAEPASKTLYTTGHGVTADLED